MRFEELTDQQAQWCAWAFGLHSWKNRQELNQQWHQQDEIFRQHAEQRMKERQHNAFLNGFCDGYINAHLVALVIVLAGLLFRG